MLSSLCRTVVAKHGEIIVTCSKETNPLHLGIVVVWISPAIHQINFPDPDWNSRKLWFGLEVPSIGSYPLVDSFIRFCT